MEILDICDISHGLKRSGLYVGNINIFSAVIIFEFIFLFKLKTLILCLRLKKMDFIKDQL